MPAGPFPPMTRTATAAASSHDHRQQHQAPAPPPAAATATASDHARDDVLVQEQEEDAQQQTHQCYCFIGHMPHHHHHHHHRREKNNSQNAAATTKTTQQQRRRPRLGKAHTLLLLLFSFIFMAAAQLRTPTAEAARTMHRQQQQQQQQHSLNPAASAATQPSKKSTTSSSRLRLRFQQQRQKHTLQQPQQQQLSTATARAQAQAAITFLEEVEVPGTPCTPISIGTETKCLYLRRHHDTRGGSAASTSAALAPPIHVDGDESNDDKQQPLGACQRTASEGLCSLHGTCHDSPRRCICERGYGGTYCELPPCPNDCSFMGLCLHDKDTNPVCLCMDGAGGEDCSKGQPAACPKECIDNPRAHCRADYQTGQVWCECDLGFAADGCKVPQCPPCVHGVCEGNACSCMEGWGGTQCDVRSCPEQCNARGICLPSGVCDCMDSYTGESCALDAALCPNNCGEHLGRGTCQVSGCACRDGWFGPDCADRACSPACANQGVCRGGECLCPAPFTGLSCELNVCPNQCSGNGLCQEDGTCQCLGVGRRRGEDIAQGQQSSRGVLGYGISPPSSGSAAREGDSGGATGGMQLPLTVLSLPSAVNDGANLPGGGSAAILGGRAPPSHAGPEGDSYDRGFHGEDCSLRNCKTDCGVADGRGTCDHNTGKCVCVPPFTGYAHGACNSIKCSDNCNHHGVCMDGACHCDHGDKDGVGKYAGDHCEHAVCPDACGIDKGHGKCIKEVCVCAPGFVGEDCSGRQCPLGELPAPRGKGTKDGAQPPAASVVHSARSSSGGGGDGIRATGMSSSTGGALTSAHHPDTTMLATGFNARRRLLSAIIEHGTGRGLSLIASMDSATKVLSDDFQDDASIDDSVRAGVGIECGGHGECLRDIGECACRPGWIGVACNERSCPNGCSAHGVCLADLTCKCASGYSGEDCSIVESDAGSAFEQVGDEARLNAEGKAWKSNSATGGEVSAFDATQTSCPSDCSSHLGRGVCSEDTGKCLCKAGKFFGDDCSLSYCPDDCSDNGSCDHTTGICACGEGYGGLNCAQDWCVPANCSGNGECHTDKAGQNPHCHCRLPWAGPSCSELACMNNCSGHGTCRDFKCFCHPAWTGYNCQTEKCPNDCSGHGTCGRGSATDTDVSCRCSTGWSGVDCSVGACLPADCNGRGSCVSNQDGSPVCECTLGYAGPGCECGPSDCSFNGMCVAWIIPGEAVCRCNAPFSGATCNTTGGCPGGGNCTHGHGVCGVDAASNVPICKCKDGYSGVGCEVSDKCPFSCVGHSHCEEVDPSLPDGGGGLHCVCDENWTGKNCTDQICKDPELVAQCLHGSCSDYECACDAGWKGSYCDEEVCPSMCSGHGACLTGQVDPSTGVPVVVTGINALAFVPGSAMRNGDQGMVPPLFDSGAGPGCACYAGWQGEDCSVRSPCGDTCSPGGMGHGSCVERPAAANGGSESALALQVAVDAGITAAVQAAFYCKCDRGWAGPNCTMVAACDPPGCWEHATCSSMGEGDPQCVCDKGFSGANCSDVLCDFDCGLHGSCVNFECRCDAEWVGPRCEDPLCPNDCSQHGRCIRPDHPLAFDGSAVKLGCACDGGWTGADCSTTWCADPTCNGGSGVCVTDGNGVAYCACKDGHAGPNCEFEVVNGTFCEPACNIHYGRCVKHPIEDGSDFAYACECIHGYRGESCTEPV